MVEPGEDSYHAGKNRNTISPRWRILVSLLLLVLVTVFSAISEQSPTPLGSWAPLNLFSAERAYKTLQSVYINDLPHPTGSLAQQQIGDRLIEYFRKLGYTPEVQEVLVSSRADHTCAVVRNIIVPLKGVRDDHGILVTAHYDSVPCGPGGMDDGVGVATVLELARVLKQGPLPNRSMVLLLSDGEEIGLLGAKAFVELHPWARKIQIMVGVDSGGDGGRSRVTQIARNEEMLVKAVAYRVKRPSGSSAIVSVLNSFNLAEGSSDFEEYKRANKTGINLINSAWNYQRHTSRDNIEDINLGTLQDHGDHLLDLIRHLQDSKRVYDKAEKMVFFDLFGRWVIHYDQSLAWILQVVSLLLMGLAWMRLNLDRPFTGLRLLGRWILVITAGAIGGGLAGYLLVNLPQMPFLLKPALILMAAVWIELAACKFLKAEGAGALIAWNILGVTSCIWLLGASYLFTIPALTMGLTSWAFMKKTGCNTWLMKPWSFGFAALLWIPLFYVMIQFGAPFYLLSIPILMIIGIMLPIFDRINRRRYRPCLAGIFVLIILIPIYLWMQPTTPRPRDVANITYLYQTNQRLAFWLLPSRSVPGVWRAAGPVAYSKIEHPLVKISRRVPIAKAPLINLPPPIAVIKGDTLLHGGKRRLILYLQSRSKARVLWAAIRPRPDRVKVNGLVIPSLASKRIAGRSFSNHDPWDRYQFIGKITKGMRMELTLPAHRRVDLILMDQIDGLPPFGKRLVKARPPNVFPVQNGDLTLMMTTYRFGP